MNEVGIYIHIPFCVKKCYYCDFVSFDDKAGLQDEYVKSLKKEIENSNIQDYQISTIYVGGGTPSYLDSKYIVEILKLIERKSKIKKNAEITIELNPGTITKEKFLNYKNAGINRLSIGLQSTNNKLLKQIGRIHTYEQFFENYKLARKIGFNNINVDLMIGLPNQSISDLKSSIEKLVILEPEHISVYSLILEEGTKMEELVKNNKIKLPDEELERNMYWYTKDKLELNGYCHYEISNFAKEKMESRHNLDCWNQKEYFGFGLSAHSYINKKRYSNTKNICEYIKNIDENNFNKNIQIEEIQTIEDEKKEFMLLALRKIKGASINDFKRKFGQNPLYIFRKEIDKLYNEDLLHVDGDQIKLSDKGLDLANLVWKEFV